MNSVVWGGIAILLIVVPVSSRQCYQCDSDFDPNCRADKPFDDKVNALVDCLSDESHTPGTFCFKREYRSPGWYGWHKVTRRCASVTDLGSSDTCTFGHTDMGVYVVECNCNSDGCNTSSKVYTGFISLLLPIIVKLFY